MTYSQSLATTLANCNFAGPLSAGTNPGTAYYEGTLVAVTTEAVISNLVFGDLPSVTRTTSAVVLVEYNTAASVQSGAEAFGPAIDFAAATSQTVAPAEILLLQLVPMAVKMRDREYAPTPTPERVLEMAREAVQAAGPNINAWAEQLRLAADPHGREVRN